MGMVTSKRFSTITILCCSALVAINSYAAWPGIYLGGQVGWGNVNETGISRQDMGDLINSAISSDNFTFRSFNGTTNGNGLAGRVFTGYQFGCFGALEFGWTKFNNLPVNATANVLDHNTSSTALASSSGTIKVDAFDLVGKAIIPLRYHFNAYGKLGLAYLEGRSNASVTVRENGNKSASDNANSDITGRFFPTFGLGIAYDFRPDIEMDLSWSRIQKMGDSQEIGSADFISLGLAFHFDKWCVFC